MIEIPCVFLRETLIMEIDALLFANILEIHDTSCT